MARPRLLHTMLRVGNLDRALDFYVGMLGMTLLRRQDFPEGRFTLAFVGFAPEQTGAVIELTHNWDITRYEPGTAYGISPSACPISAPSPPRPQRAAPGWCARPARCKAIPAKRSPSSPIPMATASN